jgi:predicted acetyltransferase
MSLKMRWVGEEDFDRVAETRAKCYGSAKKDLPEFQQRTRADRRAVSGDFVLAERNGEPIGTATCMSLSMWIRGSRVPCQGVGWVGTIKTQRRGSRGSEKGVASQIMHETLRRAREREHVVSALMPFRGSFYEHFGYGIVERLCTWTVPLGILPTGGFDDVRFLQSKDLEALAVCRQRQVGRGQCDIERSPAGWDLYLKKWEDGWVAIDRGSDGIVHGYLAFADVEKNEKDVVNVSETGYEDIDGLKRLLHFLASLRDQYSFATLTLPADLPLNRILRETQIAHRLVNHPYAEVRSFTRMQIRVLDHKRLIEGLQLPAEKKGRVVVSVKECEGKETRFAIDVSQGRASVTFTRAATEFECADHIWAPIVCGDMKASVAVKLGLASATGSGVAEILDVFGEGAVPFCQEYF